MSRWRPARRGAAAARVALARMGEPGAPLSHRRPGGECDRLAKGLEASWTPGFGLA